MDAPSDTALKSMTGFASGTGVYEDWTWTSEFRAVNGRGLDLRFRLPDWVEGLEPEVRKLCQAHLLRGNVTVGLKIQRSGEASALTLNEAVLTSVLDAMAAIDRAADATGVALKPSSAAEVAQMRGVLDVSDVQPEQDIPALRKAILASMTETLAEFDANRTSEGAALAGVLTEQINRIEALTAEAAAAIGDRDVAAREAMERALHRLLDATEVPDEARMMHELALIAVKHDVTEELDRLTAHVAAARALLEEPGQKGRKLDFLMQEFNREANTLCSKSQSAPLTAIGLDLKAVIDQMREQVQNVE
jgi:uncharacterized protein (TIGR00255 family)